MIGAAGLIGGPGAGLNSQNKNPAQNQHLPKGKRAPTRLLGALTSGLERPCPQPTFSLMSEARDEVRCPAREWHACPLDCSGRGVGGLELHAADRVYGTALSVGEAAVAV